MPNGARLEALGCRPATILKWAHDNFFIRQTGTAFCGVGASAGSDQLAYSLSQYGEFNYPQAPSVTMLDAVVFGSGPVFPDIGTACSQAVPPDANSSYGVTAIGKTEIDAASGTSPLHLPPCSNYDSAYQSAFLASSHDTNHGTFVFPKTQTRFLVGSLDTPQPPGAACSAGNCGNAPNQARLFFNRLMFGGQTLANYKVVTGANHRLQDTTAGANEIVNAVLTGCVQHEL